MSMEPEVTPLLISLVTNGKAAVAVRSGAVRALGRWMMAVHDGTVVSTTHDDAEDVAIIVAWQAACAEDVAAPLREQAARALGNLMTVDSMLPRLAQLGVAETVVSMFLQLGRSPSQSEADDRVLVSHE